MLLGCLELTLALYMQNVCENNEINQQAITSIVSSSVMEESIPEDYSVLTTVIHCLCISFFQI